MNTNQPYPATLTRIEDLTRREFISSALAAALLVACGDDDDDAGGSGDSRIVGGMFGTVTVPAQPQWVVAGESVTLGNMIALGVKPVGSGVNPNSLPGYLEDEMDGVIDITAEEGIDIEKALSLNPDLLIHIGGSKEQPYWQEDCARYAAAMPTFCYEYWYATEEQIKQNLTEVARVLGREEKARELIAEYDSRIEELKEKVAAAGLNDKPVAVLRAMTDSYWIVTGQTESIIFRDLGIARLPGHDDYSTVGYEISLERLGELNDAFVLFVYVDDNAVDQGQTLSSAEIWRSLEPMKQDRVFFVNSGIWNSVDLIGAMRIMDDIEAMLLPLGQG